MRGVGLSTAAVLLGLALVVPAQEAAALDVQQIYVYQGTALTNGVVSNYFWGVHLTVSGLDNGVVQVQGLTSYPLSHYGGTNWGAGQTYATGAALLAAHPIPVNNTFFFNQKPGGSYVDNVILGYSNVNPAGGFAKITNPLHNATGVPINPLYTWDNVMGLGQALGLWVNPDSKNQVVNPGTVAVYDDMPELITKMSWQPGGLASGTQFEIEAVVFNYVGGMPLGFVTVKGDAGTYYGMRGMDNHVDFTTIPEPMSAMLLGTATLILVGVRRRRRMF